MLTCAPDRMRPVSPAAGMMFGTMTCKCMAIQKGHARSRELNDDKHAANLLRVQCCCDCEISCKAVRACTGCSARSD